MNACLRNLQSFCRAVLALLAIALLPAVVQAAGIGFRNDCRYPVYVQGSAIINGQIKRGPLLLIKPGQTAWDVNLTKGNHTIAVYSTANQRLFQDTHLFQGTDKFYSIVEVMVPRGQPPRCDLKEMLPPPVK
jgi:hypothetical protein